MDRRSAYVFNTLSAPHGAGVLPGEDLAERYYRALEAAETAVERGDVAGLADALADVDEPRTSDVDTTEALRRAVGEMASLVDEAASDPSAACGPASRDWSAKSRAARHRVVRTSIEMRIVVSIDG
jgi:hypothetical protein